MIHDLELTELLGAFPQESFDGHVFRATGLNADPTASSTSGGRWAPSSRQDGWYPVLYTSLERDGAISEVATYLCELTPVPNKPLMVHEIAVTTSKTLCLVRADFAELGIDESRYGARNYHRTQEIGAAMNFLELNGLIAPSARWDCDNLIIFSENHSLNERLDRLNSERVEWREWQGIVGFHMGA